MDGASIWHAGDGSGNVLHQIAYVVVDELAEVGERQDEEVLAPARHAVPARQLHLHLQLDVVRVATVPVARQTAAFPASGPPQSAAKSWQVSNGEGV